MTSRPLNTSEFLWPKIVKLCNERARIESLTGRSSHTMVSFSPDENPHRGDNMTYVIRYNFGSQQTVKFVEICELYDILWKRAKSVNPPSITLTSKEMGDGLYEEMFNRSWNRPGSAMLAILPYLDDRIEVVRRPAGIRLVDVK